MSAGIHIRKIKIIPMYAAIFSIRMSINMRVLSSITIGEIRTYLRTIMSKRADPYSEGAHKPHTSKVSARISQFDEM